VTDSRIRDAAELLVEARRTRRLLPALPDRASPRLIEDAHAIQEAAAELLNDSIAGFKVATSPEGRTIRGGLLRSGIVRSGAILPSSRIALFGVEAEIAFRVDRDLPARETEYSYDDVADAVTAFAAIEVVDSRFDTYPQTPLLHRLADFMSNGAFVCGDVIADWRGCDLVNCDAELVVDGASIVRNIGGHQAKDPLLPAIALANDMRSGTGLVAGAIVTTGTYTGLNFAKRGQTVEAIFHGLGSASVRFGEQ